MPSWAQLSTSKNSSMVPIPPGKATKPSDSSAIVAFRSCIDCTIRNSESPVDDFFLHQPFRNHAGNVAMTRQNGVRNHGHETDITASVHQSITALDKLAANLPCSVRVVRSYALTRSGEDTDVSFQAAYTILSDAND